MIHRTFARVMTSVALVLLAGAVATAEPTTNAAATSQPLDIQITGVEGMVQVRDSSDLPWKKAVVGMTVTEGAEFRTGIKSAVRVFLPPDQTITLDRMGVMKLMQAVKQGNVVKTKVGMPYGRTRYDIEEAGIEHQSELVSPSSTLAIRGTKVSISDQPPFAPSAVSLTGRAVYKTAKREVAFGNKGQGKTDVTAQTDNPAQFALLQTYVDPQSKFGRPEADAKLINSLQAKGDLVLNNGQLALAFGPAVTDTQLNNIIKDQGRFNISLRWTGPGDFDLFVLTNDEKTGQPYTLGNPTYKGSVFKDIGLFNGGDTQLPPVTAGSTPDGGKIKFDQIALGGGGLEIASWGKKVPQVGYTVAIVYYDQRGRIANYPLRSDFRVDAFLDGKAQPVLTNFDEIANQTATELKFGPIYAGTASLVDSEKILPVDPPDKLKGDVRLTAVDLSIDAVGPINGQDDSTTPPTTASKRKPNKNAKPTPTVTKLPPTRNQPAIALPKPARPAK